MPQHRTPDPFQDVDRAGLVPQGPPHSGPLLVPDSPAPGVEAAHRLRKVFRGSVLHAGDPGYDASRTVWNAMIDRRPALVGRCSGVADVVAGVRFAAERDLPLSIRGGGHNIAGLAVADGALTLDMSGMRGVWVDPKARVARAQGGCLLRDVDRETQLHGLAAVLGFVSETGVAGLTLGGGFGYLTRRWGWACDNVRSMEVVTAEGDVVQASARENPDLFWGLRGGGGNFGVVTSFEYRLHEVGPEVVGGLIAWDARDTAEVLDLYHRTVAGAPPELTCVLVLRFAPPAPWLPDDVHGRPIAALLVCHSGAVSEGEALVEPIKAFGSPLGDVVGRRSWVSQQSILDATQPRGRRYYWKSEYVPGVGPELLADLADQAARLPSPHSGLLVFPLDGALNRLPADHSPVGNRDAGAVVTITGSWDDSLDDEVCVGWVREAWRAVRHHSTGGTYVNFLTAEEGRGRVRAAYGANWERLVAVKKRWDPRNRFAVNGNIPPTG